MRLVEREEFFRRHHLENKAKPIVSAALGVIDVLDPFDDA